MSNVCKLKVSTGLVFELDASNEKKLFEDVAHVQEVFDQSCAKCGNEDVKFIVREVDENKYYELVCKNKDCRAKLSFGSHKKGNTLFPKRKDDNGPIGTWGWGIYDKATQTTK